MCAKAKAHNTGSRDDASHGGRSGNGHRRATDARKSARDQQTEQRQPRTSHRPRRKSVAQRLLKARKTDRFGTWNVRTLRGIGKMEQLAMEMERYRLSMLAVTETHLAGEGEIVLDECRGYKMLFAGRKDGRAAEGVGLALTPHAWAALRHYQPVSPRMLVAEFLTQMGPLSVVVVYAPTNQSTVEDKEQFYSDLDGVVSRTSGLTMVMGDFNAAIGKSVPGVVGNHLIGGQTSDNGERLVSFASVNGLCITNTFFPHKQIHQATWYPPDARARPSTKDFVLVKQRLRPSVLDTRVYRGADLDSDHRLVIVSLRPKLAKRRKQQQKKGFDTELLQQIDQRAEYLQSIRRSFDDRKRQGNVEERWNELKVHHWQGSRRAPT